MARLHLLDLLLLREIGHDETWLAHELAKYSISRVEDVYVALVDGGNIALLSENLKLRGDNLLTDPGTYEQCF